MIEILTGCPLFKGIQEDDIAEIIAGLDAVCRKYDKGEMVLWEGDQTGNVGIVLSGRARSVKQDVSGKMVIVTLLTPGSYIGILLAADQERKSPVSVQATEELSVLFLNVGKMIGMCESGGAKYAVLLRNYMAGLSEKAMVLHDRNDCLIKPTVREKVLTYLVRIDREQNGKFFTVPLDRQGMAEYLNVERSALSRELAAMKRDGILDYHKSDFRLYSISKA